MFSMCFRVQYLMTLTPLVVHGLLCHFLRMWKLMRPLTFVAPPTPMQLHLCVATSCWPARLFVGPFPLRPQLTRRLQRAEHAESLGAIK